MRLQPLRPLRPLAAVLVVVLVVIGFGSFAAADGVVASSLEVHSIDARGGTLGISVTNTGPADAKKLSLSVDGRSVPATVQSYADAGRGSNVIVVVDNSKGSGNGAVQIMKEQLDRLAPGSNDVAALGVVTIGGGARLAVPLSASMSAVDASARSISPGGDPALWDGIVAAADRLEGLSEVNNSQIVVISGAADAISGSKFSTVQSALRRSGAALHVIALRGGTSDVESLMTLVHSAGGTFRSGSSNDLRSMLSSLSERIGSQYWVTAKAPTTQAELVGLDLDWSGARSTVAYRPDALTVGAGPLSPIGDDRSFVEQLAGSAVAKWVMILLGTVSAGMLVYSVAMLVTRRTDGLDYALRYYDGYQPGGPSEAEEETDDSAISIARKNQFFRKAVAVTGELAQRQGVLAKIEEQLERADIPLRPAEAVFFYAAAVVIATLAAMVLSGELMTVAAVVLVALLVPRFVVNFRAKRREKKFVAQLPDMLQLLAGTLRAGYSVAQGFEAVSHEIDDPMGRELRRVMTEARLGRPIEDALEAAAERTHSDDFGWAVMAIRIQREVGGNLAELLLTVAETMTQRERLRRDVSALTAEGRMSAIVLGLLPPGLAAVMWVMNPEYISRLTADTIGLVLLGISVVSMGIGFAWMKKIVRIEI